jgi:hypothetical protein
MRLSVGVVILLFSSHFSVQNPGATAGIWKSKNATDERMATMEQGAHFVLE